VRVDGRVGRKGLLLAAGAHVDVAAPPARGDELRPVAQPELALDVVFTDDAMVAVCKPAGMPTHPLRAGERGTAANAIVARWPECAGASDDPREGGVAHRLDVDTTGVLVAARSRDDWRALRRAFTGGRVDKVYLALVVGAPPERGEVRAPLAHATARTVRAVDADAPPLGARAAITRFEVLARSSGDALAQAGVVLARDGGVALVRATTSTGRMHQIRAHLAHAGWPLVGDERYGGPARSGGHVLHARSVTLPHPRSGKPVLIEAPLPADRAALIDALVGSQKNW
jgi:23S rRNA pseudouridine1911/1915/1917 synthase